MKNPREIEVIKTKSTYKLPTYKVTNKGLEDAGDVEIKFVKGDTKDDSVFRQDGIMSETLAALLIKNLEDLNTGDLENENTTAALEHFRTGLHKLSQRNKDRQERGVQGTDQK